MWPWRRTSRHSLKKQANGQHNVSWKAESACWNHIDALEVSCHHAHIGLTMQATKETLVNKTAHNHETQCMHYLKQVDQQLSLPPSSVLPVQLEPVQTRKQKKSRRQETNEARAPKAQHNTDSTWKLQNEATKQQIYQEPPRIMILGLLMMSILSPETERLATDEATWVSKPLPLVPPPISGHLRYGCLRLFYSMTICENTHTSTDMNRLQGCSHKAVWLSHLEIIKVFPLFCCSCF